jgi:phage recombination protein Bet
MTTAIAMSGLTGAQLRTVRNTVAKDATDTEFSLFMEACRAYGLDPFRRQLCLIVFNKNNPEKRSHAIFPSRDGLRVMASRCQDYRPASEPAEFVTDPDMKGTANPEGLVSCTIRLWKQDNRGEWYPVIGIAYWDEFAPLREVWAPDESGKRRPTGVYELDTSGQWGKMPRLMLQKCAEGQALRAGWPETFGGMYLEEEMDRAKVDADAAELVRQHEAEERQARIGGPGLMMVFDDSATLEKVPTGQVFDRVSEFLEHADPEEAYKFRVRNEQPLREFWAHDKAAALELKKVLEDKAEKFNPADESAA